MPSASHIEDKHIKWKRKQVSVFDRRTGVHTGAPPVAEVGTTGYSAFELEQTDILRQMVKVPADLDPTFPIGLTAVVCSGSVTVADLLVLDLLYEIVAVGGAAFPGTINDAPGTDFPTVSPTATALAILETRAIIAAGAITAQQVKDRVWLALEITASDVDCATNGAGEGFFILDLILDYVPRETLGAAVDRDISL